MNRLKDAADAYEKGLKYDPSNVQMRESLDDVKDRLTGGPSPSGGLPNLFQGPEVYIKLQSDPRTRAFMNDPSFLQILQNLQTNPKSIS